VRCSTLTGGRVGDYRLSAACGPKPNVSKRKDHAIAKNTICLWYDKDAEAAARFYCEIFPDSRVSAVHRAPGDYPAGKEGDVLTVDFTVAGIPCIGLNGGPASSTTRPSRFRSPPTIRKKPTATGTPSSAMAARKAPAAGARTNGGFPGRSLRAC
jgi:hypothetical protein